MDYTLPWQTASSVVAVAVALMVPIIVVAIRFYTRRHYKTGIAWDDWWILIALLTTILESCLYLTSTLAHVFQNQALQLTSFQVPK